MATVTRILGPVPADKWEREVRDALVRQLPGDWVVVGNVAWALPNDRGLVRDGQCDFVVLAPRLGMVILEVKGSRSVRVAEDGRWYRREVNRRTGEAGLEVPVDEAPPEQACRNMHTLEQLARSRLGWGEFPGSFAYVVAYPQGVVDIPHGMYDPTTIVTQRDMPQLARALRKALEARLGSRPAASFTGEVVGRLAALFSGEGFRVRPVDTALDARDDAIDVGQLTRQQYAAVRGVFELPRVAVLGPAGSGKTMLALWRLEALLSEGRRAVYVCFNKSLAAYLRAANAALADSIRGVDALFAGIAKPPRNGSSDDEYFSELVPNAVFDASVDLPEERKYEAIVVDEGQDLGESRLVALESLLCRDGQWLVFADRAQDVYAREQRGDRGSRDIHGTEVTFRLFHNCRNTELVNTATNRYCSQQVDSMPGVPRGVPPEALHCSTPATMAMRAWDTAHRLAPQGGAVFLSPYRLENSCMAQTPSVGHGLRLSQDVQDLGRPGVVVFSTIRSFKGLEARIVVLLHGDVPGNSPALMPEDLYVACTRATGRLIVLTSSQESVDWFASGGAA